MFPNLQSDPHPIHSPQCDQRYFSFKKLIMWLHIWNSPEWHLDLLVYHDNVYLLLRSPLCPFLYNFLLILFPVPYYSSFCLETFPLVSHLIISFSPKNSAQDSPFPEISICDDTVSSTYVCDSTYQAILYRNVHRNFVHNNQKT